MKEGINMKAKIITCLTAIVLVVTLFGCSKKTTVPDEVKSAIDDLYAISVNFEQGIATLNIIPTETVQLIYDNWDDIVSLDIKEAPISLREYVEPSIVYLDYDNDISIKWEKDEMNVTVEKTDIDAREDYKNKMHK